MSDADMVSKLCTFAFTLHASLQAQPPGGCVSVQTAVGRMWHDSAHACAAEPWLGLSTRPRPGVTDLIVIVAAGHKREH